MIMNWIKRNIDKSIKELNVVIGINGVLILKQLRNKSSIAYVCKQLYTGNINMV